jgi:CDP-glucose 4,6-dehydratase
MDSLGIFKNKVVLITGNSGFKGSWLTAWMLQLGAKVVGLSLNLPSAPAHFSVAGLEGRIAHVWGDIRDVDICCSVINEHRPDFVFHLAAQPLVLRSYSDPHETFATNAGGTLNLLEALRLSGHPCTAVFITSDKCYDNVEQLWGYRENDRLGGKDPYSGSKGAAELMIRSYAASFFGGDSPVRVAVGRAGNVIGGGDWADDRIVPDAVRAWSAGETLAIRSPRATRPWQHVLEPLAGYLTLAARLAADPTLRGEAFNFGPPSDQSYSVSALLEEMRSHWLGAKWQDTSEPGAVYEAGLLKLCCDKALHRLSWQPLLSFAENVAMTVDWYRAYYGKSSDIWELTQSQINHYQRLGSERGAIWS